MHSSLQSSLRCFLSNKRSFKAFGGHLGGLKLCIHGPNRAQVKMRVRLGDSLISNFCDALQHENSSKYLSSDTPKVVLKN